MGSFIVWVLRQLLRKEYEKAESFWMVLGGVEVNSGCRFPNWGFREAGQAVLVLSWFDVRGRRVRGP